MKNIKTGTLCACISMISVFIMLVWGYAADDFEHSWLAVMAGGIACHPSNYKLPLPSECLGLNVGANIVPFTVIGSFPSKTWNLKGARHI